MKPILPQELPQKQYKKIQPSIKISHDRSVALSVYIALMPDEIECLFICLLVILWNICSGLLPIICQTGFSLFLLILRCSWCVLKKKPLSVIYTAYIFSHSGFFILLIVSFSNRNCYVNVPNITSLSFVTVKTYFVSYLKNLCYL